MLQQLSDIHQEQTAPVVYDVLSNASPLVAQGGATTGLRRSISVHSADPIAGVDGTYYGRAVSVLDPDARGKMLLTYSVSCVGSAKVDYLLPFVKVEERAAGYSNGQLIDPFSTDIFYPGGINTSSTLATRGGLVVDTKPADPTKVVCFSVGFIMRSNGGDTFPKVHLSANLVLNNPSFIRPSH